MQSVNIYVGTHRSLHAVIALLTSDQILSDHSHDQDIGVITIHCIIHSYGEPSSMTWPFSKTMLRQRNMPCIGLCSFFTCTCNSSII